jgi:crotonobetainyl-CoA:carnitine CoA-transferase CaiB-like acyl-CoA transferase
VQEVREVVVPMPRAWRLRGSRLHHILARMADGALAGIRVIDMATQLAELCGRTLGELGAEVIKVEPPGGAAARRMGPFTAGRESDPEDSLYWAAVALGKKSVVIDVDSAPDRETLLDLVATADVFIESAPPGAMANAGLGYAALAAWNPGLVYVSVSPFGQDGPEALSSASELTIEAAGGLLSLQGDGDRPPVPVGYPQAAFHAGVQAATDVCIALHERMRSGLGQHLDVSAQAAMVWTLMNATGYPPMVGGNPPGFCEQRTNPPAQLFPGLRLPRQLACKDGWAQFAATLPVIGPRTLEAVMRRAEAEGLVPDSIAGIDWTNWIADIVSGKRTPQPAIDAMEVVAAYFLAHTKRELQALAVETGTLICPIYTIEDLLTDPQLEARGYWTKVGGRTHCGPFAKLSGTPLRLDSPAPRLGEHQAMLAALPRRTVNPPAPPPGKERRAAFDGVKVADFSWVGVGPIIAKSLADHGATVVHVESMARPDVLRLLPAFKDGQPGINRAHFMANFNTSKLGLACDLSTKAGRELALRLVDWADVVVESFTPGTMANFGLDYATLSKRKPGVVMLSTCLRGQTGPERTYSGFGGQGAALAGVTHITGWPDRPPTGPWGAYTDFINPRFAVAALASALIHRQRTGEGQYIDIAQTEGGMRFIEPLILDYTVNGRPAEAAGHTSRSSAPHGVYRCEGHERYVAIAVDTADQWDALRRLLALPGTLARAGESVTEALTAWCAGRDMSEAAAAMRAAGVPAYAVLRPTDLYTDRQLTHRGFFVTLEHGEMGATPFDGLATHFSATPGRLRNAAPCLGQDTAYVLRELLGLDEDEVVRLASEGALN